MCFRTLDLYTSAVLESTLNPVVQPKKEFRDAMEGMAKVLPGPVFMCRTQHSLHVRNMLGLQPRRHPCTLGKGGPRQVKLVLQPIFDLGQVSYLAACPWMMLSEHAPYPTPARWGCPHMKPCQDCQPAALGAT